jgi:hypothetical protein
MLSIEKCKELEQAGFGDTAAYWVISERPNHSGIYYAPEDSPVYQTSKYIRIISHPSMEEIIEVFQLEENTEWEIHIDSEVVSLFDKDDTIVFHRKPNDQGVYENTYMEVEIKNNNYHEALADLWLLCKQYKII